MLETTTKQFLSEDFLLSNETSRQLYHDYAKPAAILDYHCHLPPDLIANDHQFENITQAWLYGDHYKWRAMRTNGIDERYCTGNASDWEKFEKWAGTVPYTLRNPLYHWTHLELQRYFGISELLRPDTAERIYKKSSDMINTPEFSVRNLLKKMQVQVVCTTDDPLDSLEYHQKMKASNSGLRMLPAFRPDKAMMPADPGFRTYVQKLGEVTNKEVSSINGYLDALKSRHDYFDAHGCKLSDHGLEQMYVEEYSDQEVATIFQKVIDGKMPDLKERHQFKSAMLYHFALWDWEKGWTQQFHLGALRNNNSRMKATLGPDTGWDSIGDFSQARALSTFLNKLDVSNQLAQTIIYNLNPGDNELMATMIGNFNDGTVPGKIQYGSGWWFLDQKDGMTRQLNALSNMGLLSRFVGMITDSRSFLSYPRHEYFRRILCNLFGEEVERGELPSDLPWLGKVVEDICYNNAKNYFRF